MEQSRPIKHTLIYIIKDIFLILKKQNIFDISYHNHTIETMALVVHLVKLSTNMVSNSEILGVRSPSVNCIHFRFQTKKNKELLTIIFFHDSLPTKSCMTCLRLNSVKNCSPTDKVVVLVPIKLSVRHLIT